MHVLNHVVTHTTNKLEPNLPTLIVRNSLPVHSVQAIKRIRRDAVRSVPCVIAILGNFVHEMQVIHTCGEHVPGVIDSD
eukprot:CAMPEP_0179480836 /NCGR_PEP_ID=MMETSP0799-20121207/58710_1 /TAXON_ID=46947 /ORGANISM="Geminigera cryophila, Strain CCMP2564" /LENGTH=78 /DNA_ID=CAMNT_0021293133 /DNA_START=1710 /DNA_END=1946 /DNA_ORIENTATION=+